MSDGMDADLLVEQMSTHQLLSDHDVRSVEMAIDKYQKNCLLLDKVRLMDVASLGCFCELLQKADHQKHIGVALVNGKLKRVLM